MQASKVADLKYRFKWTKFEFHPEGCPSQKSRLPRVVIEPAGADVVIQFPVDSARAKRITIGVFPASSLGGERVSDSWFGPDSRRWRWPNKNNTPKAFQATGFYWLDIEFTNRPRYMGWLHVTEPLAVGTGGDIYLEGFSKKNLDYVLQLRKRARDLAEKDKTRNSPAFAFARFAIETPCKTSTTRAYLVDWALAERRTGLSFPSMEAFEEWAAQQGLTVIAVADAPGGGDERESESEGEE